MASPWMQLYRRRQQRKVSLAVLHESQQQQGLGGGWTVHLDIYNMLAITSSSTLIYHAI